MALSRPRCEPTTYGLPPERARSGNVHWAGIDLSDGYLHMSPLSEVRGSAGKYFAGVPDLHVVVVDTAHAAIAAHVKLDAVASRGGALFPHLYDVPLPWAAVVAVEALPLRADSDFDYAVLDRLPQ